MKYYSTELNELFDSEEALVKAEKAEIEKKEKAEAELKAKKADRAKRAKEVEKAFKDAMKAQQKADELLNSFVKDYGSFHATFDGDYSYGSNLVNYLVDFLKNF